MDCTKATIDAAGPWLDGFFIAGDVAYKRGTFMHPNVWRKHYKPWVKAITDYAHSRGLAVIYHGCGNVNAIFQDYVDIGIDGYNPLEVKAGMDVLDLRRRFGHRIAFCGNSDIQVWERGDRDAICREVLRKLNAARGGGYTFFSDHSVSSSVSGTTYDYIIKLVGEFGQYPLRLGEFQETFPDWRPTVVSGLAYDIRKDNMSTQRFLDAITRRNTSGRRFSARERRSSAGT